jgi:DNA-binding GntR family transcriptional regulator
MKSKKSNLAVQALDPESTVVAPLRRRTRAKPNDKRKLTQCEIVRSALERDIFTGQLPPESPLDEDLIAKRFSVSRTPVREALLQLIEAGLVEKPAHASLRAASRRRRSRL